MPNVNDGTAKWIPKATKGEQGPPGPQGPQGPPGSTIELGILRPGDKLIVHIKDPDSDQIRLLIQHLEKLGLRDDRVVILCGADMVVVVPQAPVDPEEVRAELIGIQEDMKDLAEAYDREMGDMS